MKFFQNPAVFLRKTDLPFSAPDCAYIQVKNSGSDADVSLISFQNDQRYSTFKYQDITLFLPRDHGGGLITSAESGLIRQVLM